MSHANPVEQICIRRIALPVVMCLMTLTAACGLRGDLYLPDAEPLVDESSVDEPRADQPGASETTQAEDESNAQGRRSGITLPH